MKTPVVLRLFQDNFYPHSPSLKVILFPTMPAPEHEYLYPEFVKCYAQLDKNYHGYASAAKLDHVMAHSTPIAAQDMEDLLQEVRKDYDIQILEGQFEVGGKIWNT